MGLGGAGQGRMGSCENGVVACFADRRWFNNAIALALILGLVWASLSLVNFFSAPTLVQRSSSEGIDFEHTLVGADKVLGGANEGAEVDAIDPSILP